MFKRQTERVEMGISGRKTPDTDGYGDWQTDWVGVG